MTLQGSDRGMSPETLAVAHIAPVGGTGDGYGTSRHGVDAGQALEQTAVAAKVNLHAARGSLGFVDEVERAAAAELTNVGHGSYSGTIR